MIFRMKVYMGTHSANFEILDNINSRYGFPALFFTNNLHLARLYATHYAKENDLSGGYVYEFEIRSPDEVIDWNNFSYSAEFVQKINDLYNEKHKSAALRNVIDFPKQDYSRFVYSDIYIVFDFKSEITSHRVIEENVSIE